MNPSLRSAALRTRWEPPTSHYLRPDSSASTPLPRAAVPGPPGACPQCAAFPMWAKLHLQECGFYPTSCSSRQMSLKIDTSRCSCPAPTCALLRCTTSPAFFLTDYGRESDSSQVGSERTQAWRCESVEVDFARDVGPSMTARLGRLFGRQTGRTSTNSDQWEVSTGVETTGRRQAMGASVPGTPSNGRHTRRSHRRKQSPWLA